MTRDDAFDRWYGLHFDRIRALCARILRDPVGAEDIAQEALLRAWVRRDQMRDEDVGAWLSVVARNLCISAMRKDRRSTPTESLPEVLDLDADPAAEVVSRESRRKVRSALARMGERHRNVLYLREVGGENYEELGSRFGLSAAGARTVVFRARRVLREHLAAVGEGFSGILLGIRIRIRSFVHRIHGPATAVEAGSGQFLNYALGVVLVTNFAFGGSAPSDIASASSRLPAVERVSAVSDHSVPSTLRVTDRRTIATEPSTPTGGSAAVGLSLDRGDPDEGTHPRGSLVLDPPGRLYLEVGGFIEEDGHESVPYNMAINMVDAGCDRTGLC